MWPRRSRVQVPFTTPLRILRSGQSSDSELFLFYANPVCTQRFAAFNPEVFSLLPFSDSGKIPKFGERFSGNSLYQEVGDLLIGEGFSAKTHFQDDLCFRCDLLNSPDGDF